MIQTIFLTPGKYSRNKEAKLFYKEFIEKESLLCVKCGACRSVCPIISVTGRENGAARGKIALARQFFDGEKDLEKKFTTAINQCLLCMSCTGICANRVRTEKIVLAVRAEMAEKDVMLNRIKGILKQYAFKNIELSSRIFYLIQRILMEKDESGELQKLRLSFSDFNGRFFPVIKNKPFLRGVPEAVQGVKERKYAFFVGCMLNVAYQGIGVKAHRLLCRTGCSVYTPVNQFCCGLPLFADGYVDSARDFALKNIEIFEKFSPDRIVVACASCGSMLKEYYPYIFRNTEHEKRAEDFSKKVVDISEILVEGKINYIADAPSSVTFHDPCHLKRGMGISEEPREVIKRAGYELKEMSDSDKCCGFSGEFSIKYPDLSEEILRRKIENACFTKAETIVTSCPGCIMQLKAGVKKSGVNLSVRHLVELVD